MKNTFLQLGFCLRDEVMKFEEAPVNNFILTKLLPIYCSSLALEGKEMVLISTPVFYKREKLSSISWSMNSKLGKRCYTSTERPQLELKFRERAHRNKYE